MDRCLCLRLGVRAEGVVYGSDEMGAVETAGEDVGSEGRGLMLEFL